MPTSTEDGFVLALARMYQLSRAILWQTPRTLSPPIWPDTTTPSVKPQGVPPNISNTQSVSTATNQLISTLEQLTQNNYNNQSSRARTAFTTVTQPQGTNQNSSHKVYHGGNTTTYHTPATQLSQPVTTTQNQWVSAPNTVTPTPSLTHHNVNTSSQKSAQTYVTVSPTIHLQTTIREQADLEALVTKLNGILEEELAISAERAYT
ncbi:hypothetical protein RFF05_01815 [Bengtsoniella intestinalis]|uniref:hypothetical protein n=1 Tax=Bengtsoniella intestinalis TaxID=3073143 RepID=UPI00391FB749